MLLNRHAARENSILKAKKEITSSPGIHSMQSSHEANTVKTIELHQTHKTRSAISYMSIASAGMASIFAGITLAGSIGVPPEVILTSYRAMIQMFFGGQGFIEDLAKLPEHAVNLKNLQEFLKAGQGLIEADQKKKSFAEMQGHKIEINNLSFSYPDKDVFKNVNLSISEGDFILLSGENGTGKSTLFGCLMGQTKAQSGEIRIGGIEIQDLNKFDPKKSFRNVVAYANQSPNLISGISLRDNLLLGLSGVDDSKIIKVLEEVGLYEKGVQPGSKASSASFINGTTLDQEFYGELSGGQKLKFALARTLLRENTKIIVIDEPTASLDPKAADAMVESLYELQRKDPNLTIICISHDQRFQRYADEHQIDVKTADMNDIQSA
jgi:ABC-type multidrug transport system fused ATPase/permease subunit